MINSIKPNIGLWISSEPSSESLQIVQNFAGCKSAVCQSNELERKIKHKTGGAKQGPSKSLGEPWPTLRTTTVGNPA